MYIYCCVYPSFQICLDSHGMYNVPDYEVILDGQYQLYHFLLFCLHLQSSIIFICTFLAEIF